MTRGLFQCGAALLSGVLFGVGLVMSGMTQPTKVLGFLDVFGRWDPSLLFVMIGAIAVHALGYRMVLRRARPWFAGRFFVPVRRELDATLLIGAAVFGAGWGLSGYCPGPSVAALGSGRVEVLAFVLAVVVGIAAVAGIERLRTIRAQRTAPALSPSEDSG